VVWATTVGAVVDPNWSGRLKRWGAGSGSSRWLARTCWRRVLRAGRHGRHVWSSARPAGRHQFGTAPDGRHGIIRQGLAAAWQSPRALLGPGAIVIAHTVMVSVMVMTPIHLQPRHATLELIGLVISVHVVGMFAFSRSWDGSPTGSGGFR
jgi:hypothetical protein